MNSVIKWGGIFVGICLVLIVGAVVLVPRFVDVQKYKSDIESLVEAQTGRRFSMGDDIKLSVFPWVGVSLSDLKLGNAKGFDGENMISVKGFEVRLKVMPLLSRQVQVDTFIMDSPQIILGRNKAGKGNWENIGPAGSGKETSSAEPAGEQSSSGGLPIASLMVGKFAILNGFLSYVDQTTRMSKKISDLNLELTDISLDKPVKIDFRAKLDGRPLSIAGQAGPVGREPGKTDMTIDLVLKALDELALEVKGQVLAGAQKFDMTFDLAPFSPRKLFASLDQPFPVDTKDPKVLDKVSLKATIKGTTQSVTLADGVAGLDDSVLNFTARAQAFEKPDIKFDLALDKIDLDRYLPPSKEGDPSKTEKTGSGSKGQGARGKTDYGPLRKMVLDGKATIGSLKAANLKMENVLVQVTGKNGVFNLDPFSMDFYQGKAKVKAKVDVRKDTPVTSVAMTTRGVQAGPMITDAAGKEMIEGTLAADLGLTMTGDTPEQVKKSLGGKGELAFTDGAVIGIDIAGTIRNAKSGFGLTEKPAEKPRTDFAELKIPYTAEKGLVNIPGAGLVSPLIRLVTTGKTDLVKESLDFRIEPKLVATLKGQGDTKDRSGLLIPLVVTGTYTSPKVRPDLKAMVGGQIPDADSLKQILKGQDDAAPGDATTNEDKAKSLLKGFLK